MGLNKLVVILYLAICVVSFFISAGEGYLGTGSTLSLLLTLPWSLSMIFFAWALIHDGARSLLVFLVPFAAVNGVLLYKLTTRWVKRWHDPDKPAA